MSQQPYHTLSDALRPPVVASVGPNLYSHTDNQAQQEQHLEHERHDRDHDHDHENHATNGRTTEGRRTEEEEEEEEEDPEGEDDAEVEGHLTDKQGGGHITEPSQSVSADASPLQAPPLMTTVPLVFNNTSASAPPLGVDPGTGKRRPGRPRGSKTKKAASKTFQSSTFSFPAKIPNTPGAPRKDEPTREYYDFRWKVIHLCNEFYTAAEELIKSASPHVMTQCFEDPRGMGHPLTVIDDAKRVCEFLISQASSGGDKIPDKGNETTPHPSQTITAPQSFSMPLRSAVPGSAYMSPPVYPPPPPGQYPYGTPNPYAPQGYPTTPYYHHPPGAVPPVPPPHYYQQLPPSQPLHSPSPATHHASTMAQIHQHVVPPAPSSNQGPWSDEEVAKLKELAARSRELHGDKNGGEADWDWVTSEYGTSRTRHQILIKATHLGLKESTTRMGKRKREGDGITPSNDITPSAAPSGTVGTAAQNQAREGTVSQSASPAVPHTEVPSASNIPQHSRYPAQLTWKSTSVPFTSATSGTITSRTTAGTSRTSGSTTFRQYYPPNT